MEALNKNDVEKKEFIAKYGEKLSTFEQNFRDYVGNKNVYFSFHFNKEKQPILTLQYYNKRKKYDVIDIRMKEQQNTLNFIIGRIEVCDAISIDPEKEAQTFKILVLQLLDQIIKTNEAEKKKKDENKPYEYVEIDKRTSAVDDLINKYYNTERKGVQYIINDMYNNLEEEQPSIK